MLRSAALALVLVGQAPVNLIEAQNGVYEDGKGAKIEALGVCDIGTDHVRCWNREGVADEALVKRIESYYASNEGGDLQFRPGRKNRYGVFRVNGTYVNFSSRDDNYLSTTQSRSNDSGTVYWVRLLPDADVKTMDVVATLNQTERLPSADLPFKVGQTLEYRGATYEVGAAKAIPKPKAQPGGAANPGFNQYGDGRMNGPTWSVVLGRRPVAGQTAEFANFEVLDAKGNPIRYVDPKGKPVSEVKFLEATQANNPGVGLRGGFNGEMANSKGYVAAQFGPNGPSTAEAFVVTTNIDPAEIGTLRLYANRQTKIRFAGLPVDGR